MTLAEAPTTIRAAIAILTWRGEVATRACLQSLLRSDRSAGLTVIVDNGSGTGEGERLAAEFGVSSLVLPANGGVPAGYNAAIRWAREQGATHVLLANNDVEFPDANIASRLAACALPDVAAVGPIVRNGDQSIWNAGGRIRRWLGHAQRTTTPWQSAAYDVDWLDGSCLLLSIDAACRIGGLAPEFFLYWEETDWCARARRSGLRLLVDPTAGVTHGGRGSATARLTRRYALRNSLLYVRRNLRGLPAITAGTVWLCGRVPSFFVRRVREGSGFVEPLEDVRWAIAWHVRDAARHGWRRPAVGPDLCS